MQGGGIWNQGNLTLTTTLLHNNTPDDLDNEGSAYYVLPAPPGRYIEGVVNCTQQLCPPDYKPCPIQNCLPANYGNMTVILPQQILTEAELLPNCSAGFYANRTLSAADPHNHNQTSEICSGPCPPGHTCPKPGTVDPLPVPPGNWSAQGSTVSQLCPLGHYCEGNTSVPAKCPAGTLGDATGLNSSDCHGPCPEGSYCEEGSAAATPCADGTFGEGEGLVEQGNCTSCQPGRWCRSGFAYTCSVGTFSPFFEQEDIAACLQCPFNTTTLFSGATNATDCACLPTFFDDLGRDPTTATDEDGARLCASCPLGFDCSAGATTTLTAVVTSGFWRPSANATFAKPCPIHGTCVGGGIAGDGLCAPSFRGTYCSVCEAPFHYLDTLKSECRPCAAALAVVASVVGGVLAVIVVLYFVGRLRRLIVRRAKHTWSHPRVVQLRSACTEATMPVKLKLLLGYGLVVAQLQDVYQIRYPPGYQSIALRLFSPLRLQFFGWIPGLHRRCFGIETLDGELLLYTLLPLGVVCTALTASWVRRRSFLPVLPFVLRFTYLLYTAVSSKGFQTLAQCDCFDQIDGLQPACFLRTDYSVVCPGTHGRTLDLLAGSAAVIVYGVGVPLLYAALLFSCRAAIRDEKPTPRGAVPEPGCVRALRQRVPRRVKSTIKRNFNT